MDVNNQTSVTEFILLGLSDQPNQQPVLFAAFITIYLLSLLGNVLIMTVIFQSKKLHTAMYLFICNLNLVDIGLTTTTVPKMLVNINTNRKSISYMGCITQLYFFIFFTGAECILLTVMAFDRYVAICIPLLYPAIMKNSLCVGMISLTFTISCLHALLHTLLMDSLSFCGPNQILHYFCDIGPLLKLSCTGTSTNELVIFTEGSLLVMVPFVGVLVSYICIVVAILRIRSAEGRSRAFSTCSSHLTVVSLFYGTLTFMYFRPSSDRSFAQERMVTIVYNVLAPMLNPFIYSLRNKEVKQSVAQWLSRMRSA